MQTFATLLWIDERNKSSINNKNKSIESYFRQIRFLAKSLHRVFNQKLVVLTNENERCKGFFSGDEAWSPDIVSIESRIQVPDGIRFYAAHHKLSALIALRQFLSDKGDRFFLLDADVFCNRGFLPDQFFALNNSDLIVLQISDQVFPAYGAAKIKQDIEEIAGEKFNDPQWFGGEFISGNIKGLNVLIDRVRELLPQYLQNIDKVHHVGDEMFVTAALNSLIAKNDLKIVVGNPYYFCSRHWSRNTTHSIGWNFGHSFIHCPGSKPALEFLSLLNPSVLKVRFVLEIYKVAVLFYQSIKKYRKN